MSSESSSDSQPGKHLVPGYDPFIGDVPISSYGDPFPLPKPDTRSQKKIDKIKKKLDPIISDKVFNPPVKLSDFCLIAHERWQREEDGEPIPASLQPEFSDSEPGCNVNCYVL